MDEGYNVSYLHGKLEPHERDSLMQAFRDGRNKVLITTDVLSRGVDVESVTLVVNYHIPITVDERQRRMPDPETYVHRIGRTGRAGRRGIAITFVAGESDKAALREIERYYSPDEEMVRCVSAACTCRFCSPPHSCNLTWPCILCVATPGRFLSGIRLIWTSWRRCLSKGSSSVGLRRRRLLAARKSPPPNAALGPVLRNPNSNRSSSSCHTLSHRPPATTGSSFVVRLPND